VQEQSLEQHTPTVSELVFAKTVIPETSAALGASVTDIGEKSPFSYRLELNNVTDEILRNTDIPTVAEPVMNFSHELTSQNGATQSNVQEGNDSNNSDFIDKNNDEVVSNSDTSNEIAPEQRLQHGSVTTSAAILLSEEEGTVGQSEAEEIIVDSPVSKSQPFATVIPHRCPIITKDMETIQQALLGSNVADEDGFIEVVSKSSRKQ